MREAAVAGRFYEKSREGLREQVRDCFLEAFDNSMPEPVPERRGSIIGMVSPHAGFLFSGATAARGYGEILRDGFPKVFIIIGPLHGRGNAIALGAENYVTPLGEVEVDQELANALWKPPIDKLNSTHRYEHSIEVQLPFLQYFDIPFKMVPIAMGKHDIKTSQKVGETIADVVKKSGMQDDVVIIASSDFSHLGRAYGNIPMPQATPEKLLAWMDKYDGMAISKIESLDAAGLLKVRDKFRVTACGAAPIAAMLTATKRLGATRGEKLQYTTSYEKSHSADGIVGYGSIAIKK